MKTVLRTGDKVLYKKETGRTYFFQQWGVEILETNTDVVSFTVAVIMDIDGKIKMVSPENVTVEV